MAKAQSDRFWEEEIFYRRRNLHIVVSIWYDTFIYTHSFFLKEGMQIKIT